MAKDKKGFILYCDYLGMVSKLPDEVAGKLLKTILEYVNDKNPVVNDLLLQVAFEPIKQQLKRDLKNYEKLKVKRAEIGKKGGEASAAKRSKGDQIEPIGSELNQIQPNPTVIDTVIVTVTDTVTEIVDKGGFKKPTIDQISEYCLERKNKVSPERFFNHYESNGWMVGKTKMKNWKAAIRNWESNGYSDTKGSPPESGSIKTLVPVKNLRDGSNG